MSIFSEIRIYQQMSKHQKTIQTTRNAPTPKTSNKHPRNIPKTCFVYNVSDGLMFFEVFLLSYCVFDVFHVFLNNIKNFFLLFDVLSVIFSRLKNNLMIDTHLFRLSLFASKRHSPSCLLRI